jgi:hypothetical protein
MEQNIRSLYATRLLSFEHIFDNMHIKSTNIFCTFPEFHLNIREQSRKINVFKTNYDSTTNKLASSKTLQLRAKKLIKEKQESTYTPLHVI